MYYQRGLVILQQKRPIYIKAQKPVCLYKERGYQQVLSLLTTNTTNTSSEAEERKGGTNASETFRKKYLTHYIHQRFKHDSVT